LPRRWPKNALHYERDFVTRFGTLRLRIARSRKRGFLPAVLQKFQRRAEEVSLLIREAFLRGVSTRQVGRLVAISTGEPVSPQTVSRLSRDRDEAVRQFHQAPLQEEWAYLFLEIIRSTLLTFTKHTIGRVCRRIFTEQRSIYSIFQRFNLEWKKPHSPGFYTSSLTSPKNCGGLTKLRACERIK